MPRCFFFYSQLRLCPAKPLSGCATAKYALVSNCSGFQRGADAATQKGGLAPQAPHIHSFSLLRATTRNQLPLSSPSPDSSAHRAEVVSPGQDSPRAPDLESKSKSKRTQGGSAGACQGSLKRGRRSESQGSSSPGSIRSSPVPATTIAR